MAQAVSENAKNKKIHCQTYLITGKISSIPNEDTQSMTQSIISNYINWL